MHGDFFLQAHVYSVMVSSYLSTIDRSCFSYHAELRPVPEPGVTNTYSLLSLFLNTTAFCLQTQQKQCKQTVSTL